MASDSPWKLHLHPRLRVTYNGDDVVNAGRAGLSSCVASAVNLIAGDAISTLALDVRQFGLAEHSAEDIPAGARRGARGKIDDVGRAAEALVNVVVETEPSEAGGTNNVELVRGRLEKLATAVKLPGDKTQRVLQRRGFLAARVPVSSLGELAGTPGVMFVHPSEPIALRLPTAVSSKAVAAPPARTIRVGGQAQTGKHVLIGIIDVGGFDFGHPDFLDDKGDTRFVAIWDQGGRFRPSPKGFSRGSELTEAHLKAAVHNTKGWPATVVERQSQMEGGSHATHVASIAAGRKGVCPEAQIAGVLIDISLPEGQLEQRQWTFVDSSSIIEAIEYLNGLAKDRGLPLSINISLGTNGGPHDGANGTCRWIDSFLASPGRAICAATGNAGQERGQTSDDLGWIMGRIHTSGRIAARGLEVDLDWVVVGDGISDVSENELEIWYGAQDRIAVSLQPPGSTQWYTVSPGEYLENKRLANGGLLSIYNELYHPVNGENYIAIYLSPNLKPDTFAPIAGGTWRVRLHGLEIRDGGFHGWIERDDPAELQRVRELRPFRFPSFFSSGSNVDSHSISSLACAHRVIAVGNADERSGRINISSSQGPTRDGRSKPEAAAPGTDIIAASGFDPEGFWVSMTGTSMASPYVCGVVALMLAVNTRLTAAQCQGILKRTAKPLPSSDYSWKNDVGYGLVDPVAAIEEARLVGRRNEV